eukprot:Selendium_serpulae@DN5876_c0_g1_i2.p1
MGVTVPPPYTAENCSGETAASLERFRKVLDGFHSRREQKKSPGGGAGQQAQSGRARGEQNAGAAGQGDPGEQSGWSRGSTNEQVPSNKAVLSGDGKAKEGEEPRTQSSGKLGETGSKRPFSGNGIAPFPKTATPRSQAAGSRTAPTGSANASRGRNKLQTGGESSVDAVSAESGRLIDSKQGPSAQAKDLRKGNKLKDTPVAEAKKAAATISTGASRASAGPQRSDTTSDEDASSSRGSRSSSSSGQTRAEPGPIAKEGGKSKVKDSVDDDDSVT